MIDLFVYLLVGLYVSIKIVLEVSQIFYIRKATVSADELHDYSIDLDYFKKSNAYNIDKLTLSIINIIISSLLLVYFIFLSGISDFSRYIEGMNIFGLNNELMIIIFFFIFLSMINIPIGLYKNFHIEDKYGFNRSNLALYVKDYLISLILSIVIVAVLFSVFNFIL